MLTSPPGRAAARTFALDLRDMPHSTRHSVVFARLDDMGPADRMMVVCECEPSALRSQIAAWWPGEFDWCYEDAGPSQWRAAITRRR